MIKETRDFLRLVIHPLVFLIVTIWWPHSARTSGADRKGDISCTLGPPWRSRRRHEIIRSLALRSVRDMPEKRRR